MYAADGRGRQASTSGPPGMVMGGARPRPPVGVGLSGHVASVAVAYCPQCASEYEAPARFCGQCGTSLPGAGAPPPEDPWLGQIVDRRYRVLSRVGAGGMGLVYKVEHIQLAKIAAMKVLHEEMARDADAVRRFRTEAQAVSRLDHPNIVQTFDFGQSESSLYLVMEYLKGDDLAAILKREGPIPFPRAARLFIQICSALTDAHEAGVIHRDLKPENIVVIPRRDGTETAKVLDFGLAKLRERTDAAAHVTSGNQVIGTPYYMSPEQVRSEPLDVRTDVYSLGATFYRVLTGTPPFQATTPVGVLTKHVTDPLEPPRLRAPELNLPPAADAIVSRAMAKAREDRYASAADVKRDLEVALAAVDAASGAASLSHPPGASSTASTTVRDEPAAPRAAARRGTAEAPTLQARADEIGHPAPRSRASARSRVRDADADPDADLSLDGVSGADRLRRQEFDAFEHGLRRRRLIAVFGVPLAIAAGAVALGWTVLRGKEKAAASEREPNDTPAQATLLPLDRPVDGRVGKRLAEGTPDLDYFRIPYSKRARAVSARLEGIPGVDLVLELYDGQGTALAKSDARGAGGGEWLQPTLVGPGEAFLLVRQLWTQGAPLVEDAPDPYKLSAHFGPPEPGWEIEPNDSPATATPFVVGQRRVRGYLGSAEDRDWYAFSSLSPGTYVASVTAPTGVDAVILTAEAGRGAEGPAARVAKRVGAGEREQTRFAVVLGKPSYLGVARKPEGGRDARDAQPSKRSPGPPAPKDPADDRVLKDSREPKEPKEPKEPRDPRDVRDPKEQGAVGLDDAYEISIEAVTD